MVQERTVPATAEAPRRTFLDRFWDYAPRERVESELFALFRRQATTSAVHAKGLSARIAPWVAELPTQIGRAEIERLPVWSRAQLRAASPDHLLTSPQSAFHMVRGTGGTTDAPMWIFWTRDDWSALTQALQRFCAPISASDSLRVWNGYNQSHVSGPAFDALARALGGTPIPRHFRATDAQAIEDMERTRANVLVVTPKSGSGKGGSLEDLLSVEPDFLKRLRIRALLVSSTRLEPELAQEAREQGVKVIVNFYGSTEAPPAAVSCELDPTVFHLAQGHVLVEIVGDDGRHVRAGERGKVVVSRIGSCGPKGIGPAGGTQLLRYAVGDTARYLDDPCGCGRSSARMAEVARFADLDEKLKGGCERWE